MAIFLTQLCHPTFLFLMASLANCSDLTHSASTSWATPSNTGFCRGTPHQHQRVWHMSQCMFVHHIHTDTWTQDVVCKERLLLCWSSRCRHSFYVLSYYPPSTVRSWLNIVFHHSLLHCGVNWTCGCTCMHGAYRYPWSNTKQPSNNNIFSKTVQKLYTNSGSCCYTIRHMSTTVDVRGRVVLQKLHSNASFAFHPTLHECLPHSTNYSGTSLKGLSVLRTIQKTSLLRTSFAVPMVPC